MHWSEQYLGWEYVTGERDCAVLAAEVQRDVFGRDIRLPRELHDSTPFSASAQFRTELPDIASRVDSPADGDLVLMLVGNRPAHIGVYCATEPPSVLHALQRFGSAVRHSLSDLPRIGLKIEGFYRCN